ncbi:MAG: YceI family protein [Planctomycetales bacterium]|nr:YceI family protein [Planctomycetales bacterium]
MRRQRFAVAGVAALGMGGIGAFVASASPAVAPAQNFNVDPVHSSVLFKVKRPPYSTFYAMFHDLSGKILLDPMNAAACSVDLQIKADSLESRNPDRNKHLRSPDFFSVKEFPVISFKSTKIAPGKEEDTYVVTGDLTLHGVTKPITLTVRKTGEADDPMKNHRAGFETSFKIQRSDFGMKYGIGMLSDEVELILGVDAIRE